MSEVASVSTIAANCSDPRKLGAMMLDPKNLSTEVQSEIAIEIPCYSKETSARLEKKMRRERGFTPCTTVLLVLACLLWTPTGFAVETAGDVSNVVPISAWMPLIIAESVWLILVGLAAPAYAAFAEQESGERRGLNLPRGSVRSILALLIVGSFVNVLVFAPMATRELDTVITAFGTLTGSVVGFYFGSRTAK